VNNELKIELIEATEARRTERRAFLRTTASVAAVTAGGSLLASCGGGNNNSSPSPTPPPTSTPAPTPAPTPTPTTNIDPDIFNFALNLEYLEAQFYVFAVSGQGLPDSMLSGTGTRGNADFTGARQVPFQDPVVRAYAREIAADEEAHVAFLRRTLGAAAVAQPALDLRGGNANSAFGAAARAAGLDPLFNPYADDNSFLLGAFIFEDVGVTAYKGAARLITNKGFLEAAAGILAAEAYHAGLIRTVLYGKGIRPPTEQISTARDSLDGPSDIDQGVAQIGDASNIVPTDANGLAFSRSAGQVLNIVYLNRLAVTAGGFFPAGVNGNIRTSAAN
jgi:hypothetical protein